MSVRSTVAFYERYSLSRLSQSKPSPLQVTAEVKSIRIRGAMVARLTPDQKVACSIHEYTKADMKEHVQMLMKKMEFYLTRDSSWKLLKFSGQDYLVRSSKNELNWIEQDTRK
ncbi:hypothetical protein YC2023_088346 [Brassica napus]